MLDLLGTRSPEIPHPRALHLVGITSLERLNNRSNPTTTLKPQSLTPNDNGTRYSRSPATLTTLNPKPLNP